jgi:transcriptional regulator with XRE-family HTH domain
MEAILNREEIIRNLIKEKGMSIKAFAESIAIPYTTLHSMLERGIGKASFDSVISVCKSLNITAEELEKTSESLSDLFPNILAAHINKDLTDDEKLEIIEYVKYIKSKRK